MNTMKRFTVVFVSALLLLIIGACSDNSNPISTPSQSSIATSTSSSQESINLFSLPHDAAPLSLAKKPKSVLITPAEGGDVELEKSYKSTNGKNVSISMKLKFSPGTVSQPLNVTIALDKNNLVADFSPNGAVFNKPALLDVTVEGLDLSSISSGANVAFYYMNGSVLEKIEASSLTVDIHDGKIVMKDAKILHFSIYGFGFTK